MPTVLVGVLLVVEVVEDPDDAPELLVAAALAGQVAHHALHSEGVHAERRALH